MVTQGCRDGLRLGCDVGLQVGLPWWGLWPPGGSWRWALLGHCGLTAPGVTWGPGQGRGAPEGLHRASEAVRVLTKPTQDFSCKIKIPNRRV